MVFNPDGLLTTKRPLESAAQSSEVKVFQFLTSNSRVGWPANENNRIRLSPAPILAAAIDLPSGESDQFHPTACSSNFATSCDLPGQVKN